MPTYATKCEGCGQEADLRLSFADYDAVKLGVKLLECGGCQGRVSLVFDPGDVKFVLKDGESGGWASKATKENAYRAKRHAYMGKKQADHAPKTKLRPNFAGQETGSWAEAKAEAYNVALKETGSMVAATEASSTYDSFVKTERAG